MRKKSLIMPAVITAGLLILVAAVSRHDIAVLQPAGTIGAQQKTLLLAATFIMLLIVIPIFGLTFYIIWKYRATNKKATYQPEWDGNRKLEALWWGFPCAIILVLAAMIWNTSHSLDPSKALVSNVKPLTIQVVALQWKWLFIYPEQQIASVNYVQFPAGTPVNFQITADAPMNSFWIPKLGGQIYAMSGMTTKLHLMADRPGTYNGVSANLSGEGFADMHFIAQSTPDADFDQWVARTRQNSNVLNLTTYNSLAQPSVPKTNLQYSSYEPNLFNSVVMKYMAPHDTMENMTTSQHDHAMQNTENMSDMEGMMH